MQGFVVRTRRTHVPSARWWFETVMAIFWCADALLQLLVVRLLPRWLAAGFLVLVAVLLAYQVRVLVVGRTVEQLELADG